MDLDRFKKFLLDEGGHIRNLGLNHYGEPFLNPGNADFVLFASELGIEVSFSSNATLITRERADDVIHSGLSRIIFSLDGLKTDTFNLLRVGANLESVEAGIHTFLAAKLAADLNGRPFVEVQFIETPENSAEWHEFLSKWSAVPGVDQVVRRSETTHAGAIVRHQSYSPREEERQACRYLWESVVVTSDGTVVPCCKDFDAKEPLGNVFGEQTLAEIWNGQRAQELRTGHTSGNFSVSPLCHDCNEWTGHPAMDPDQSKRALANHLASVEADRSEQIHLRDRNQK